LFNPGTALSSADIIANLSSRPLKSLPWLRQTLHRYLEFYINIFISDFAGSADAPVLGEIDLLGSWQL